MSLNNIELKTYTLAQLYSRNLVQTSTKDAPKIKSNSPSMAVEPMPVTEPVKYLGNNEKNILVVVDHAALPFLPDEELSFLSNVLSACKLSLSDIAVINRAHTNNDRITELINTSAERVILFAVQPPAIGLPINFPAFQLQQFNKRTYLHAPGLSDIQNDKSLKTQLWNALKILFGI